MKSVRTSRQKFVVFSHTSLICFNKIPFLGRGNGLLLGPSQDPTHITSSPSPFNTSCNVTRNTLQCLNFLNPNSYLSKYVIGVLTSLLWFCPWCHPLHSNLSKRRVLPVRFFVRRCHRGTWIRSVCLTCENVCSCYGCRTCIRNTTF